MSVWHIHKAKTQSEWPYTVAWVTTLVFLIVLMIVVFPLALLHSVWLKLRGRKLKAYYE